MKAVDLWSAWLLLLTFVLLFIAIVEKSAYYASLSILAYLMSCNTAPTIWKDRR